MGVFGGRFRDGDRRPPARLRDSSFHRLPGPGLNQAYVPGRNAPLADVRRVVVPHDASPLPAGAYLPGGGIWHSQTNEGIWTHIPGLRVCVPSTPEDAAAMLWTCAQWRRPDAVLVPKHLMRVRVPVGEWAPSIPGKMALRREGIHVTLVTWGNALSWPARSRTGCN